MSSTISRAEAAPTRREFLYYLGGASMALFAAGAGAVVYKFVQVPDLLFDEPAVFEISLDILEVDRAPVYSRESGSFLVKLQNGLIALSQVCPWVSCHLRWVKITNRFECPCHGDMFQLDGTKISGRGSRDMDRITIWVETPKGIHHTPQDGSPVPITDATRIWVDPRFIIPGQPRA